MIKIQDYENITQWTIVNGSKDIKVQINIKE